MDIDNQIILFFCTITHYGKTITIKFILHIYYLTNVEYTEKVSES